MSNVIKIENLSKKYLIGHQKRERYIALRDVMMHKMRGIGQRLRHPLMPNREEIDVEEFWALKDINLEIKQGDRVGIIGRNGAGKSTLLKVLSRITEPTNGRITLNGRVASLLEVGTGFHPELSGRENIYLNGAILGMSRREIKRKFDEIVAFAEVEKFLDTPVKRYSSGMYVRLAFAVAAHLEPEILIVDEVLAVGDAQFQKKCMGKMEEVGKEGRTVLFVSHNMAAIQTLCTKTLRINEGEVAGFGQVDDQIHAYLHSQKKARQLTADSPIRLGSHIKIARFKFMPNPVVSCNPISFELELISEKPEKITALAILIYSENGARVGIIDLRDINKICRIDKRITLCICGELDAFPLVDGVYKIGLFIDSNAIQGNFFDIIDLNVISARLESDLLPYPVSARGVVCLPLNKLYFKAYDK